MSVEYAPRGLIGVLTPQANTTVEPEFGILWPAGIGMINARMISDAPGLDDRLIDYTNNLETSLRQFHNAPIDAVAFACTGASYLIGPERERELVDRLSQKMGVPFITSAHAVIASLGALGATRIGLVSPYPTALTDISVTYWEAVGLEVAAVAQVSGDGQSFHPIYSIAATGATDGLRQMADARLDAIVMLGTGMPTLEPILEAAGILETPTMSCMLCLAYASVEACDKAGSDDGTRLKSWIAGADWGPRLRARAWHPA
jgi:maleate isomerase